MLMVRLNVKCSTFVLLMELEVLLSTVSCVPMEPSSTRTTSSVTGGSTSTVLLLMLDMLLLLNMKVLKVLAEQGVRDLQAVLTGDKANPLVLTTLIAQNLKTLYLYF